MKWHASMAHGVGIASFVSNDNSTWYSKQALMAVAYELVFAHRGMATVASSIVVTRSRRNESNCYTEVQ